MTFYGESLQVDYVQHIGGDEITNDVQKRAGSATLASGDEWRAWLYPGDATYLTDTDPVMVSWVIEVASGTVTFDASMGIDPAFGSPSAPHPTSLGTHTVTGPATMVLATTLTAADVLGASDSPMLVLAATSGSAVVQQIKVRAWPPGGAVGGWSDLQPSFSTGWTIPGTVAGGIEWTSADAGPQPSIAAAWAIAIAGLTGAPSSGSDVAPIPVVAVAPSGTGDAAHHVIGQFDGGGSADQDPVTFDYTVVGGMNARVVVVTGAAWSSQFSIDAGLVEGVDYIRAPEEVQSDFPSWAQQVGSGSTGWANAAATIDVLGSTPSTGRGLTIEADATDVSPFGAPGTVDLDLITGATTLGGQVTLPTGGRYIIIHLSHTMVAGDLPAPPNITDPSPGSASGVAHLGTGDPAGAFLGIRTRAVLPPYRVWQPDAVTVTVHPLRLMQRGDGLGMGSGRIFGAGTRQGSIKVFGSL